MSIRQYPGGSCVYSITNKLNGMQYIGITSDTKKRFKSHCGPKTRAKSYIKNAIHEHGKESFNFNVLVVADRRYCMELEAKLIMAYNTLAPSGYNICGGGEGPVAALTKENHPWFGKKFTQEHRDKIGASHRGLKRSEEFCNKMSVINTGKTISEEQKQKISKSLTGKKLTLEHCENMRKAVLGIKRTEETKRKMSDAAKARKPMSAETKIKMSNSAKARELAKRLVENVNEH
jgi:group I intron endonuclease